MDNNHNAAKNGDDRVKDTLNQQESAVPNQLGISNCNAGRDMYVAASGGHIHRYEVAPPVSTHQTGGAFFKAKEAMGSTIKTASFGRGANAESTVDKLVDSTAVTTHVALLEGDDKQNLDAALEFFEREFSSKDPVIRDIVDELKEKKRDLKKTEDKLDKVEENSAEEKTFTRRAKRLKGDIKTLKKELKDRVDELQSPVASKTS